MKLIIQIPCLNEELTLPSVLRDLPKLIPGIDLIETQVIDDGSTDGTIEIAKQYCVDHIINLPCNMGLAAAFRAGVENALLHDADILVNTDGDNQYNGEDIVKLVQTMLTQRADLVVGCRPIVDHEEFPPAKKMLQLLGSRVVRFVSRTNVPDAASGFRAYSRNAMLRLNVVTDFSYCIETIIQAGLANMKVCHTPIRINPKTRSSRLFKSVFEYVFKQLRTIISMFILYRSSHFFSVIAGLLLLLSIALTVRFVAAVWFFDAPSTASWPTVTLAGTLLVISCIVYLAGILAALMAAQRKLSEETLYHLRRLNLSDRSPDMSRTDFKQSGDTP
jgi:glycosyltransferase involved in cell wall biosynthesis